MTWYTNMDCFEFHSKTTSSRGDSRSVLFFRGASPRKNSTLRESPRARIVLLWNEEKQSIFVLYHPIHTSAYRLKESETRISAVILYFFVILVQRIVNWVISARRVSATRYTVQYRAARIIMLVDRACGIRAHGIFLSLCVSNGWIYHRDI